MGKRPHGHAARYSAYTGGPDPLARRYDFSADPLDYANEMMEIVHKHRGELAGEAIELVDARLCVGHVDIVATPLIR